MCRALRQLAEALSDFALVYPVHLNPAVREPVHQLLGTAHQAHLIDPLPYAAFVWLMQHADIILTDSGNVQEEAVSSGKPVLVLRDATERPEGVAAGNANLVGTDHDRVVHHTLDLLANLGRYQRMSGVSHPYGDGTAAVRVVEALVGFPPEELQR